MRKKIAEVLIAGALMLFTLPREDKEPEPEMEREVIYMEFLGDAPIDQPEAEEITAPKYNTDLIARVVMSEAGGEPYIGKVAVAATIINRADKYSQTVEQVVYAPNQYAKPYGGVPNAECYKAVVEAINHRDLFPRDMLYFRTKHYHSFGVPYTVIGAHYFSTTGEGM